MNPWIDSDGVGVARFPVRLRSYRPDALPPAAKFVDCLILINDSGDGNPRQRLALSNGASWDVIGELPVVASAPSVMPVERSISDADLKQMAASVLQMADMYHDLVRRVADLERTAWRDGDAVVADLKGAA